MIDINTEIEFDNTLFYGVNMDNVYFEELPQLIEIDGIYITYGYGTEF